MQREANPLGRELIPEPLDALPLPARHTQVAPPYADVPHGQRPVTLTPSRNDASSPASRLIVVEHWDEEHTMLPKK